MRSMAELKHNSPSRRALDHLLEESSPEAVAVREHPKLHRTMLWRYRTGRGRPDAAGIALIAELSKGRVPAGGWVDDAPPPPAKNYPEEGDTENGYNGGTRSEPDFDAAEREAGDAA